MSLFLLDLLPIQQCHNGWKLDFGEQSLENVKPVLESLIVVDDDLVTNIPEKDHVFNWMFVDNLILPGFQIPPGEEVFGNLWANFLLLFLFFVVMMAAILRNMFYIIWILIFLLIFFATIIKFISIQFSFLILFLTLFLNRLTTQLT